MGKLTDRECRNIAKYGTYSDGEGLYLLVNQKGKYWRRLYRFGGKRKMASFGVYPTVSLKEARKKNAELIILISKGIDPNQAKKQQKQQAIEEEQHKKRVAQSSFVAIAEQWAISTELASQWAQATKKRNLSLLNHHLLPTFGKRTIDSISALEIATFIKQIEAQGKNTTAHKTLSMIKAIFDYAVMMQYLPASPAASIKGIIPAEKNKPMRHIDPTELGRALLKLSRSQYHNPAVHAFLILQPMLFLRPNELLLARWQDIEGDILSIPAERMKKRRIHQTPLPKQAIAALDNLRPFTERFGNIFHNPSTGKPITREAALKQYARNFIDTTSHGFRHTASTLLNEHGYSKDIIEAQLAHKDKDNTRATYNHAQYIEQRRQLLQTWADYLDELKAQALAEEQKKAITP